MVKRVNPTLARPETGVRALKARESEEVLGCG